MKKLSKNFTSKLITYAMVIVAYIVMASLLNAGALTRSIKGQLVPICVYIVMAVSLNLTVGISGELSLGHAGFMAVGAYGSAIFTSLILPNQPWTFPMALIVGGTWGMAGIMLLPIGQLAYRIGLAPVMHLSWICYLLTLIAALLTQKRR